MAHVILAVLFGGLRRCNLPRLVLKQRKKIDKLRLRQLVFPVQGVVILVTQ